MKNIVWMTWLMLLGTGTIAFAQTAATAPAAVEGAETQPETRVLELPGVIVDLDRGTVRVNAEVCLREGPLEFLLCLRGTKDHESILSTRARGADIHAGLLALGLKPGKPPRWTDIGEDARFLPAAGARVRIDLRWTDAQGALREMPANQWLLDRNQQAPEADAWVFIGSEILPEGTYWADQDGGLISVGNFASSVLDVPFESTGTVQMESFVADSSFNAHTESIPPIGTDVEIVLTPLPGAEKAEAAREMLEIDRFGRFYIQGQRIAPKELAQWATKFISTHSRGMVVIRASARALTWDVLRAREELMVGGVRDFDEQRLFPETTILPRTPDQARRELEQWKKKFSDPSEYLTPPDEEAKATLDAIERQIDLLKGQQALLREYEQHLRQKLRAQRAETQPATKPADDQP